MIEPKSKIIQISSTQCPDNIPVIHALCEDGTIWKLYQGKWNEIFEATKIPRSLKSFLRENDTCDNFYEFAKDLTLEEFLDTCERGDWILWLFQKVNPESLKEITLAKGHCANTVRHLMKDERSRKAVDVAIAFGEGRATRKELNSAADAAANAASTTVDDSAAAAAYAAANATYSDAATDAAIAYAVVATANADTVFYVAAKKGRQRQTADICRKYLPLEIWNQQVINEAYR